MLRHGKKCFGLRQGSEIDPSSWPYTCFCLMDMLASHQALSFRLSSSSSSSFFQFWGFQIFWIFLVFLEFTQKNENFQKFLIFSSGHSAKICHQKKNATQLTRLPKAQCSHMYSSLSEEWLQANQVEHIDCLTQILEYSIQFLSSHTHIPPLSPRTPKHNSPIASESVVNRLVEQGY